VCGSVHACVHVCARDTRARCRPSAVAPWDPSRGRVAPLLPTGPQLLNRGEGAGGGQVAPQGAGHGARQALSEYLQHHHTLISLHSSSHFSAILPASIPRDLWQTKWNGSKCFQSTRVPLANCRPTKSFWASIINHLRPKYQMTLSYPILGGANL
jgi:hypothetical protein